MKIKEIKLYIYNQQGMINPQNSSNIIYIGSAKEYPRTVSFKNKYEERNSFAFRRDFEIDMGSSNEIWFAIEILFHDEEKIIKRFKTKKVNDVLDADGNSLKDKELIFSQTGYIREKRIVLKSITQTNDMTDFDISFQITELDEDDTVNEEDYL